MKISSLIIGKGSGSAGNITVVQLKGQTILKQKATTVANPKTAGQMLQRNMINRAVYAWQLLQNGIKQGWTSLLPFSSQYNTYVSTNAQFFKDTIFTKSSMKNLDLIGSVASKGSLGQLNIDYVEDNSGNLSVILDKQNLNSVASIGDKVICLSGDRNQETLVYSEKIVDQAFLDASQPTIETTDQDSSLAGETVVCAFVVTADKKNSTTSTFQIFPVQ
jgi:hypothetical protein